MGVLGVILLAHAILQRYCGFTRPVVEVHEVTKVIEMGGHADFQFGRMKTRLTLCGAEISMDDRGVEAKMQWRS